MCGYNGYYSGSSARPSHKPFHSGSLYYKASYLRGCADGRTCTKTFLFRTEQNAKRCLDDGAAGPDSYSALPALKVACGMLGVGAGERSDSPRARSGSFRSAKGQFNGRFNGQTYRGSILSSVIQKASQLRRLGEAAPVIARRFDLVLLRRIRPLDARDVRRLSQRINTSESRAVALFRRSRAVSTCTSLP